MIKFEFEIREGCFSQKKLANFFSSSENEIAGLILDKKGEFNIMS